MSHLHPTVGAILLIVCLISSAAADPVRSAPQKTLNLETKPSEASTIAQPVPALPVQSAETQKVEVRRFNGPFNPPGLADLYIDGNPSVVDATWKWEMLPADSCAVKEGVYESRSNSACFQTLRVPGCAKAGRRKLLRFNTKIVNNGTADFVSLFGVFRLCWCNSSCTSVRTWHSFLHCFATCGSLSLYFYFSGQVVGNPLKDTNGTFFHFQ